MLNNITVEIGGQQIDKHLGHWMEAWAELTEPNPSAVVGTSNATTNSGNALYLGCYPANFYGWVGWLGYLRFYNDFRDPVNPAEYESVLFGA